jgi:hypothetical protein
VDLDFHPRAIPARRRAPRKNPSETSIRRSTCNQRGHGPDERAISTDVSTCKEGFTEHNLPSLMADHDNYLSKLFSNLFAV